MKYCEFCGKELPKEAKFCDSCGKACVSNTSSVVPKFVKREIVIAVILTLITCGIYDIYWFITMTDDSNTLVDGNSASGGLAFLFTLLTCGIYGIYWSYMMGKKMYEAGKNHGKDIDDNSVIYLILSIFGLGIVNYCIIQNDLNKFAE